MISGIYAIPIRLIKLYIMCRRVKGLMGVPGIYVEKELLLVVPLKPVLSGKTSLRGAVVLLITTLIVNITAR
jgi:hypothetical protein